jgi:hypothetical protein
MTAWLAAAGRIGRNVAREGAHTARSTIGVRLAVPLLIGHPRAQRFGKQEEPDARERLRHNARSRSSDFEISASLRDRGPPGATRSRCAGHPPA